MDSDALIHLALNTLSCPQKELAALLGVSPTQISKWKKGEHMSQEMEDKIRAITQIGDRDARFVLWCGSIETAIKWERLIHYLAELARYGDETGYDTEPLNDDLGLLCWNTFYTLKEMGVDIPKGFPEELEIIPDSHDDDAWELDIDENPYSSLIYAIYKSLTDVYGFYAAYVSDLMFDEDLDLYSTPAENIEPCLMLLAASKVDVEERFAENIQKFRRQTIKDYEEWLTIVKNRAFRAGIPLRAELLDMVYGSHDEIGHEAEAESLGINTSRIHPDIYMNELLVGMRIIHQVLPAILNKLGIEEEFQLDPSELQLNRNPR
ncbi:MAG: helix-turn-helix transcriptional regulator [Porticoccaceae bacterium]